MITTIYTCDKCKKDVDKGGELFDVELSVTFNWGRKIIAKQDWCEDCMIVNSLQNYIPKNKENLEKITPPPTLEDFIRDMIYEVVSEVK
jgi:hypothetical protein